LFWGKGRGGVKEKEVMRRGELERNLNQGKGPDACFAARQIYKAPSPRKYILPDIGL
jgi:hypothetical protein